MKLAHLMGLLHVGTNYIYFHCQTTPSVRPKSAILQEPMEVGSPSKEQPKSLMKEVTPVSKHTPPDDFVMVPDNIPSDHSVSSNGSGQRPPSSVDLNAIFR